MVTKERLHDMIDALSDGDVATVARILEALTGIEAKEPFYTPETAPLDDEPETEAERKAVAEARAELAAGRVVTLEELEREYGLR
jgi:hypothetical protein